MDMNKFTEKARQALAQAQSLAVSHGHQEVDVEHLMAALLGQEPSLATSVLNKAGGNGKSPSCRN